MSELKIYLVLFSLTVFIYLFIFSLINVDKIS